MVDQAMSKTQQLAEAAKQRAKAEVDIEKVTEATPTRAVDRMDETEIDGLRERADGLASVRVQAVAGSLTGKIDIDAMGDVKGDGGDAKDYDDGDPAKALGVPVYEHGLAATKNGVDVMAPAVETLFGSQMSEATRAEIEAGRAALNGVRETREASRNSARTVVTDASADEDGKQAAAALSAKEKALAKAKAE